MRPATGRSNNMLTKKTLILFLVAILAAAATPDRARAQPATPVPTLTPVPTPTPHPMATARVFHCSCSGPGRPVVWAGTVQAQSYFQARQQASGQCLGALSGVPVSPQIAMPNGFVQPTPVPPVFSPCSNCACN